MSQLTKYEEHLSATLAWLGRSIDNGRGGSCAYFAPIRSWSGPYPETTGYLIPTLIEAADHVSDPILAKRATALGEWLLGLQAPEGWWPAGVLGSRTAQHSPSVFNTAQILHGMTALARATRQECWLDAAGQGARWLASGVNAEGAWLLGSYRPGENPSYYTQVAWPMLEVWRLTSDARVRDAARRVLRRIVQCRAPNGVFSGWGFDPTAPAPTHTVAYTLRGLIESAWILDDWEELGAPCEPAIERIARKAELRGGDLGGAIRDDWTYVDWYSCLTGNAQLALCLLRLEERSADLRLVNAASKLVDRVCRTQLVDRGPAGIRGGVAGSWPPWGRYMTMRYPNWAAKYHADALMALRRRLRGAA